MDCFLLQLESVTEIKMLGPGQHSNECRYLILRFQNRHTGPHIWQCSTTTALLHAHTSSALLHHQQSCVAYFFSCTTSQEDAFQYNIVPTQTLSPLHELSKCIITTLHIITSFPTKQKQSLGWIQSFWPSISSKWKNETVLKRFPMPNATVANTSCTFGA